MAPQAAVSNDASEVKRKEALVCLEQSRNPSLSADERLHKMKDAFLILEEAIKLNPQNHRARFLLVSCCMNADEFRRAKDEGLLIYNALTPDQRFKMGDAVLHISLAHASKMLGELEDAIQFALEASQAFPEDPHPHMILGELYEANDQNAEAEQVCRQALRHQNDPACKHHLNPQSVYFTYCCLGACLIKQGKHTEAERFLGQATELGSSSTLALRHLVDVYHFQGRHEEALQVAHSLAEMDPNDDEIRQKIEVLMQTTGSEGEDGSHLPGSFRNQVPASVGPYDVIEVSHHLNGGGARLGGSRHGSDHDSARSSRHSEKSALSDKAKAGDGKKKNGGGDFMCCCFEREPDPKEKK